MGPVTGLNLKLLFFNHPSGLFQSKKKSDRETWLGCGLTALGRLDPIFQILWVGFRMGQATKISLFEFWWQKAMGLFLFWVCFMYESWDWTLQLWTESSHWKKIWVPLSCLNPGWIKFGWFFFYFLYNFCFFLWALLSCLLGVSFRPNYLATRM